MTYEQLFTDLKADKYKPVYLLHGAEPFFIDELTGYIEEHALPEAERGFNQTVLYGKDTDIITVLNAAKCYPMMAERQVLIVKEAQDMKWPKPDDSDKKFDLLMAYLENPLPSTVLVFAHKYKSMDKRLRSTKLIEKNGVVFTSAKLYETEMPKWITAVIKNGKRKLQPNAAELLTEYLGTDLGKVRNEIDKLFLNIPEGGEITLDAIRQNIGISKEYNVFELTDAISTRNLVKAYRIIDYFSANPKIMPLPLLFGNLNTFFQRLLRYHYLPDQSQDSVKKSLGLNFFSSVGFFSAVKNYPYAKILSVYSLLREYDLKMKGVGATNNTPQGDLMKELFYKIMH